MATACYIYFFLFPKLFTVNNFDFLVYVAAKKVELFWFKLSTERAVSSRQHVGRVEWLFATLDMSSGVIAEWKSAGKTH